jgi:uncharacterized protein YyaL (SSP411 family)
MAKTNALIKESSPYLLQHAHNPVDWLPWSEENLAQAKEEGKLVLISIGYAACHWCHVMEKESFEDQEVAQLMNDTFINIKIDREERPDIDQLYMNAVQLMTQRGGWPLHCILLPDGRPIWGGTYFSKADWMQQIKQVSDYYLSHPEKIEAYAKKVVQGIQQTDLVESNSSTQDFSWALIDELYEAWEKRLDHVDGGSQRAPKFPLPNNYLFLLRYAHFRDNENLKEHVQLTLKKMGDRGLYDQIGGGFARYSTDSQWKVPHFEKMLYDNAQIVSLYSEAYQYFQEPRYQEIVEETLAFVQREMMDESGAFYSALDADSEGEEGLFYTWSIDELKQLLGDDFSLFQAYYKVDERGAWEGRYILLREEKEEAFAQQQQLTLAELQKKVKAWKSLLHKEREGREKPGLDDKSLTSWNTLMCSAYIDAYKAFQKEEYLSVALKNAQFIIDNQLAEDGRLWHSYKEGKSTVNGYLEDYACSIAAFLALYEVTFDENWIRLSKQLTDYCYQHFSNEENELFFFTSSLDPALVARKTEVNDQVIPASNSMMANNLFLLGEILQEKKYSKRALQMLHNISPQMSAYGGGYSNWGLLMMKQLTPFYQIVINGAEALTKAQDIQLAYQPHKLLMGSSTASDLPLLSNKFVDGETIIYVCVNKSCQLPTTSSEQAIQAIQ